MRKLVKMFKILEKKPNVQIKDDIVSLLNDCGEISLDFGLQKNNGFSMSEDFNDGYNLNCDFLNDSENCDEEVKRLKLGAEEIVKTQSLNEEELNNRTIFKINSIEKTKELLKNFFETDLKEEMFIKEPIKLKFNCFKNVLEIENCNNKNKLIFNLNEENVLKLGAEEIVKTQSLNEEEMKNLNNAISSEEDLNERFEETLETSSKENVIEKEYDEETIKQLKKDLECKNQEEKYNEKFEIIQKPVNFKIPKEEDISDLKTFCTDNNEDKRLDFVEIGID